MKLLVTIIMICVPLLAGAQHAPKKKQAPPAEVVATGDCSNCKKGNRLGNQKLKAKFPFSACSKVIAISFTNPYDIPITDTELLSETDLKKRAAQRSVPGLVDTFGYRNVHEIKELNAEQVMELAADIFDLDCSGPHTAYGCYNPRNAFVFLDAEGQQVANWEICLECHGHIFWPAKFDVPPSNDCRYKEVKKLLQAVGLAYGTE